MDPSPPEFNKFRWNDHPVRVALKGPAGEVATVMFNRAKMDGTSVFVTQESLAKDLDRSVRTVRRAQKQLESLGLIRCVVKGSNLGNGKPSVYQLTMPQVTTGHLFAETTGHARRPPDTGVQTTGQDRPDHRTPVSALIDPLIDPGNRPGSLVQANTDVSAEESSFADRLEIPLGSAAATDTTDDTDPDGAVCLGAEDEPRQGSALGGHEMSALECGTNQSTAEGNQPVNYDPFDPFRPSQAAEADFGSWPPVSSDSLTADEELQVIETEARPAIPDPLGIDDSAKSEPIRWPSGKPLPKPGDPDWLVYDPFGVYVDATTGELLTR